MSTNLQDKLETKRKELESLKKITELTTTFKNQLVQLNDEIKIIEEKAGNVSNIMEIWDSIIQSISAAGLGLLRYGEENYKTGLWEEEQDQDLNNENSTSNDDNTEAHEKKKKAKIALPEGLVRVNTTNLKETD